MPELKIKYVDAESLKTYANNAKEHPAEQVEQIKQSIEQFGFNDPIAVWKDNEIIEGHGRLLAALELGIKKVPVISLDGLTDEQRRAYMVIHNKLTMNSDFNADLLALELSKISDIDMSAFGFDISSFAEGEDETEGGAPSASSFNYQEQYGVIVMCKDEHEQEEVYTNLTAEGYTCKVVSV